MSGQMKKSKRQLVNDFIKRVNPYEKPQPIAFDLRGYAAFVVQNGLKANEITSEMMKRFVRSEK